MSKKEFLKALKKALSPLSARERKERLSFYSEIIDDKIEEGITEADAVREIGSPTEIAAKIFKDTKISITSQREKKGKRNAWERIIMIAGAPLWIPIAVCCAAVIFSGYLVAFALLLALWAVEAPFLLISLLSKGLFPVCIGATKGLSSFLASSLKKLSSPFKK